jgi:putative transcriptional regulator
MENTVPKRRDRRGPSQGDLAEAVGVTRQTINAIERDRYDPPLELGFKLALYFGCHVEEPSIPKSTNWARKASPFPKRCSRAPSQG